MGDQLQVQAQVHLGELKPTDVAVELFYGPLDAEGLIVRGHEFHHSNLVLLEPCKFAYRIRRGHGIQGEFDGMIYKNLFATYTHLHALGTREWAPAFVSLISKERKVKIHSKKIKPSSSFPLYI